MLAVAETLVMIEELVQQVTLEIKHSDRIQVTMIKTVIIIEEVVEDVGIIMIQKEQSSKPLITIIIEQLLNLHTKIPYLQKFRLQII